MSAPALRRLLNRVRRRVAPLRSDGDRALIAAYAAGDQAAFAELVRRHGAMVHGVARRVLGDVHAAEDVGQATFLVLARKAAGGRWDESIGGWLHGVAYRLALKARTAGHRPIPAGGSRPATVGPDVEVERRELRTVLDTELRALPARYRGPLVLCYLEGRTRDEAARQLGVTVSALKGRLERGRELLRARLTRRGCSLEVGLTAAALSDDAASVVPADRWVDVATGADAVPPAVERLATLVAVGGHAGRWVLAAGLLGLAAATAGVTFGLAGDPPQPPAGPPAAAVARTDRFGDPLPAGAVARLGTTRWRAAGTTGQVAFSRDGKLVIAATSTGLQFWDAASGRPIDHEPLCRAVKSSVGGPLGALALSPDGRMLATGSTPRPTAGSVRLWDVATGAELPFPRQDVMPIELVFSSDGKSLACRSDGTLNDRSLNRNGGERSGLRGAVLLWEVPSGRLIGQLELAKKGDPESVRQHLAVGWLAYAPDGKTLYTAGRSPLELFAWDTETGQLDHNIALPLGARADGLGAALALSPDGTNVVVDARGRFHFVDVKTGRVVNSIDAGGRQYDSLAYADHGKVLTGWWKGGIDFYDLTSGQRRSAPESEAVAVRLQTGALYSNSNSGGPLVILSRHGQSALGVFDATSGRCLSDPAEFVDGIASLAVTADGRTLSAAAKQGDFRLRRWNLADGKELPDAAVDLKSIQVRAERRGIVFSPAGRFLAWAGQEFPNVGAQVVNPPVIGPDGKPLPFRPTTRARLVIKIVETATGTATNTLDTSRSTAIFMAWSPDEKTIAAIAPNDEIQLWDVASGNPGKKFTATSKTARPATFAPDGKTLAVAYARRPTIIQFDVASGEVRRTIPLAAANENDGRALAANFVASMAFTPDGRTLAGGTSSGIRRWDLKTGAELKKLDQAVRVVDILFSPDGRLLFAGGADGSVWAWDTATGAAKQKLAGHTAAVTSMVLTPDGKTLITGSADTTILVWNLSTW